MSILEVLSMVRFTISILFFFMIKISIAQPESIDVLTHELKQNPGDQKRIDIYADMAYNLVWGDAAKALEYANRGIELADSIGYDFGRAKCLSEAGLALLYQGYGPESLEYLFEAIEILEDYDDDFWKFTTLSSIGYVYWEQNEHASSIEYFKQAKPYTESLGIDNFKISILSDIGETYIQLMEVDSGMKYIKESFDLATLTKDTFQIAVTSNQLGILHRLSDNLDEAINYSRLGIPFANAAGFNQRRTYLNLAEVYHLREQMDSCIYFAKHAVASARSGSFLDNHLLRTYTLLADAYKRLRMQDSMVVYLQKQIETNSLIVNQEKTKRIQGIVFERQLNEARIEQAKKDAEMEASLKRQELITRVGFSIAIIILLFSSILINRYRFIQKQKKAIQSEKDRSENLLLNILPAEVIQEVKEKGYADARSFEEATVLFTDFKEFTAISEKMSASELVKEINTCFKAFDQIIDEHRIEKIKTIGDAYMAAGGLHIPRTSEPKDVVMAALNMQAFINQRKSEKEKALELAFEMRVGIHTGPVVAGIVGVKKFQYDIWGDTVNTAARLESHGEIGKVNISQTTYELVKNDSRFNFEHRGKVHTKGKGMIEMWFVSLKES